MGTQAGTADQGENDHEREKAAGNHGDGDDTVGPAW